MKVAPVSRRWGAALALASLSAAFAVPSAQAAAPVERSQAVKKALTALQTGKGDDALTVFALRAPLPAGTEITQAGPETTVAAAARSAAVPTVSARLARAGVKAFGAGQVVRTTERSWFLYADEGPSQAFEHPGRVVVVGQRTGKVTVTEPLRWVPLVDGRLPVFFRTAAAHQDQRYRVFDRAWKQRAVPAAPLARAAQAPSPAAADAQKRLADALATERSCALRVSDTLGDFYDFARVDKTRAALGRVLSRLARLNPGFVTQRYRAAGGRTPIETAQQLIARGCGDLLLYVTGSGTRTGAAGVVVGLRAAGRSGVQWHTVSATDVETLVRENRNVSFKLVFDAPYAGRMADQLKDERNVSVLLAPGGAGDPSFTYLPQIVGGQGVIANTTNPTGLLEFTNELIVGMERFAGTPAEIDHAIAERAAGRSDSVLAWMIARALDMAPAPFTRHLLGTTSQPRVPATTGAAPRPRPPVNHAPVPLTPPQFTREDVPSAVTLLALDADQDPLTFTVLTPPSHGTFSGTAPFLRYTPDRDFHGFDSFKYRVSDGRGGVAEQTVVVTVISDNDAPTVVSGPSTTPPTFTENGTAVVVDNALTITDPDSAQLVGAKAQITAGHVPGDVLAATPPAGIAASYDAATGVLTFTGTASRAAYQSALRSVTFGSTSDDPGTARTIRLSADDGDELGLGADRSVVVTPINDAPVLTSPAGTVAVDEDTAVTFSAGGPRELSVTDVDAGTGDIRATLTASTGTLSAGATLPGLVVTGAGTSVLQLTGTVAEVRDALDGLAYTPAQDASGPATIAVAVTDQGNTGTGGPKDDTATVDLAISATNDAPVLAPATGAVAYTEDGAAATVAGTLTVSDADDTTLESATVRIAAGRQTGDALGFVDTASVDGTYDAATGTLTLVPVGASATLAQYQAALRTVTFSTTNDDPTASRTLELTADDGDDESTPATRTVTITPANDAPQIANAAGTTTVAENDADGEVVDAALTLADPDDTHLTAASVAITANRESGDRLTFTNQNGISGGTYDAATGTLALTGTATVAQYRDALRSVRFVVGGQTPTTATRTVRFTVSDGDASATSGGRSVDVQPVNDTPVNTVPGAQTVNENGSLTFAGATKISVADDDAAAGADLEVTLTVTGGTFDLSGTAGLTFSTGDGDDDATATFMGTTAALNAALDGLVYTPTPGTSGARQLTIATDDQGHTGGPAETDTDTVAIQVLGINRAPVNTLPVAQTTDEDTALVLSAANGNALTIADPDAGSEPVQVALAVTNGTLTLAQTTGLTIVAGADGSPAVTVRGTLTDVNAAFDDLRYTPTGEFSGGATLSVTTDDLGNTGTGGAETDQDDLTITVAAVNDGPALTAPAAATVVEEGTVTFSAGNVNPISVADVDSGAGSIVVDLTATGGTATLGSAAGVTVTGNGTAAVKVTGTRGAVNAALEGTTFTGANDFAGAAQLKVDVTDQGNTGSGGAKTDSKTIAITVTGVNDAPVIGAPTTASVNQNSSRTFSTGNGNAISIADVDAGAGAVQVTLGVAQGTLSLAQTTGLTFTTGDGSDDAALVFTGTLTDVNAALNGLVYKPTSGYDGPDELDVDVDDQGHTGAGTALTDSEDVAISVNAANTAPVNTVPGAQTLDEDTPRTFAGADKLAVADDNVDASTGELEVDLDVDHGTLTLDGTAGLTFTVGDGVTDTAMTFKGSPNAINAALDGLVYTPALHYAGSDTLTIVTDDLGVAGPPSALTDTDTVALTVTARNDPPVLAAPAAIAADEDVQQAIAGVSVADVDAGAGDIRVRLAVANGTLTLGTKTGLSFPTGDGAADAEIVAEGTVAELNTALATLSYTGAANVNGADTLDLDVSDLGLTGAGGAQTDAEDVPITIAAVNDAPVNTTPGAQTINEDTPLTLSGASALAVADVDASTLRVTLQATAGTLSLSGTAGLSFTTGSGVTDTTMTFTGTKAAINTALDGLSYTPDANFNGAAGIDITTNDQGATGSGGAQQDQDTVAITINPVNDAPVLTQPDGATLTYTEDVPSENHGLAIAPNLTVADIDNVNVASATVTLAAVATGDALVFVNQNGITGTYDNGTGVLTLTGSASKANYETALRSVTYRTTSENPDTTQRTITFRVNDGQPANNLSNQVTRAIDVVRTNDAPVADDETFDGANRTIGNTSLVVDDPTDVTDQDPAGPQKSISGDILAGDTDPDTAAGDLTVTPQTNAATTGGGRITIQADGDFTYLPEQGCADTTDTFAYTVTDNHPTDPKTDTGTLTFSIADCVWYVDDDAPAPAAAIAGTSQAPYPNLGELDGGTDEDGANHRIFLYAGSYTTASGFPLEAGQQVLSQRHGLAVPTGGAGDVALVPAGGTNSTVSGGVTLATDNTLQGVHFGTAAGAFALSGSSVGTLTVNTATAGGVSNPSGGGVSITGTSNVVDVRLDQLSSGGGTNGLVLNNASGTFQATSGTIANASGPDVSMNGGTADVTLNAGIADDAGQLVSIQNTTGGTKDLNGAVTDFPLDGDGGGVALSGNTGATIRFDGGLTLSTGAAHAFSATGGGTVAVQDPAGPATNTIDTTTGTPLTVTGTTIHADDLTFERISANNAQNGIVLSSTGNAGGLTVTGDGSGDCTFASPACSGGVIQETDGPGVLATNVGGGISLTRTRIHSAEDDGIRATTVTGLQITDSLVTSNGDAAQERGLDYTDVTGVSSFNSSEANGNHTDNLRINNSSGSLEFNATGSRIVSALNGDGFQFYGAGTATMKADIESGRFENNKDDGFQLVTDGANTATMHLNFIDNDVVANASQIPAGALVTLSPAGSSSTRVNMFDNRLNTSKGSNLILNPAGTSQFDATITGGSFQNAEAMGIAGWPAQSSQARIKITDTLIQGYNGVGGGMYLSHSEAGTGRADFIVQGNTISNPRAGTQEGMYLEAGNGTGGMHTVCADIGGAGALANDLGNAGAPAGGGTFFADLAFQEFSDGNLILPGVGATNPAAFLTARNTGGPEIINWGASVSDGPACQTPNMPPAP